MAIDGVLMEFASLSRSLGAEMFSFGNAGGFSSVSIDSRTVKTGALFAALPGSVCDGHAFVEGAFKNGAVAALVERAKLEAFNLPGIAKALGKIIIAVDNTLRGLQDAARVYLEQFPRLLKIGITGSSGKTTTKEIAAAIIGVERNTVMNPGNFNSETGLPLAAFNVQPHHEVGIFEMGMSARGEIAALASVLKPDIALITNIGSAHIGNIGSKEGIALEKKNIFSQFDGKGIALIPEDSSYRELLAEGVRGKVSFYGEKSFSELGDTRSLGLDGSEITWAGQRIRFALPGKHSLVNALAAIAIARELPVSAGAVKQGLESVQPLFGRGEIIRGRITVIRDCYNSNPESLAAVLEFCESLDWPGRRIYVIGDMLELGDNSRDAHRETGRLLAASKADMVFFYGKEIKAASDAVAGTAGENAGSVQRFFYTGDMDELSSALKAHVRDGDLVLLKGSRGCALEKLSGYLHIGGGDVS